MSDDIEALREKVRLKRIVKAKREAKALSEIPPTFGESTSKGIGQALGGYADLLHIPQKYLVSAPYAAAMSNRSGVPYDKLMGKDSLPTEIAKRAGVKDSDVTPAGPLQGGSYTPGAASLMMTPGPARDVLVNAGSDPVSYLAGAANRAAVAAREAGVPFLKSASQIGNAILNPVEAYSDARAGSLYGKAFEGVDRVAINNDKPILPSKLMRQNNFVGGPQAAEGKFIDIDKQAGQKLGSIRSEADARGVKANLWKDVAPQVYGESADLRKLLNEDYANMADKLDNKLIYALDKTSRTEGRVPYSTLAAEKKGFNDRIYGSGQASTGDSSDAKMIQKAMSNAYQNAEENVLQREAPDLFDKFKEQKDIYSSASPLISDKQETIANQVKNRRGLLEPTEVDAMGLGGVAATGDPALAGAMIAKKGLNLWTKPSVRTARGYLADKVSQAGSYGLLDDAVRQLGERYKNRANPWGDE